jgi:hypothetical protein
MSICGSSSVAVIGRMHIYTIEGVGIPSRVSGNWTYCVPPRNAAGALGQEPYQRERIRSHVLVLSELGSILSSLLKPSGQQGVPVLDREGVGLQRCNLGGGQQEMSS